ncbi:MAG TPA: hypothetical protein VGD78_16735 [Chthoniobacterales bacterium]
MNLGTQPFAVVLLIGPNPVEIERARDLAEALEAFEGGRFNLVLVDDDLKGRPLIQRIAPGLGSRVTMLPNPRRGRGSGWGSGAAAGVLAGLRRVVASSEVSFVLKLDTDSLVIGACANRIRAKFAATPGAGILGAYQFSPARMKDRTSTPALEKLLRQFSVWRRTPAGGPALQLAFWGRYGRIRNVLRRALLNGYRLGEHCSGGGYAVSAECLQALHREGYLDDPTLWLQAPLGEDAIVALLAAAAGYGLEPFDQAGDVFAVRHLGLPDAPDRLVAQGRSVIHSVKDHGDRREADIRTFFKSRRPPRGGGSP